MIPSTGSLHVAALFPVNMGNRGQNVFAVADAFERLRVASTGVTYIGHHRRLSGNFVFQYKRASDLADAVSVAEGILGLRCIARPMTDLGSAVAAIPGDAVVVRGSVVVPKKTRHWRLVLIMLSEDISEPRRMTGLFSPRVEAVGWTSPRDVMCLYDRPSESGDVGQVTRCVLLTLSHAAVGTIGTGRAMGVICDLIAGRYVPHVTHEVQQHARSGGSGQTSSEQGCI